MRKTAARPCPALCAQLLATDDSHRTADELTDALGDKNWTVRASAARSLAKLNYHGVMPQLRDMMLNDKTQPARFSAVAAIVRLEGHSRREVVPPARPGQAGKCNTTLPLKALKDRLSPRESGRASRHNATEGEQDAHEVAHTYLSKFYRLEPTSQSKYQDNDKD